MSDDCTSVVIVSRHRPSALQRCLLGLKQQDHRNFEVILVVDPASAATIETLGLGIKIVRFDEPNISAARNIGLAQAAGKIVAFIDDDAVAEPTWLTRLSTAFEDPRVVAATGFVRGRNGISYQWKACEVDAFGIDHPLEVSERQNFQATPQRALKTQGTNCAFLAASLRQIGGFDPAYRFYLDEADVNLRLASLGLTAVVPNAQVHHGFEASVRRNAKRVPLSLRDIGCSSAVFLRRHAPDADFEKAFSHLLARETARVALHLKAGNLDYAKAQDLLGTLNRGWAEGMTLDLGEQWPLATPISEFQRFDSFGPRKGTLLSGRIWQKRRLLAAARRSAATQITTVICLSPTARPHSMSFHPDGFWLQTGGLFGRSDREGPRFKWARFRHRITQEAARWIKYRPID